MNPKISTEQWFDRVCQSYSSPPVEHQGRFLPAFPSDELQLGTTGQAGVPTLREAFIFYQDCVTACETLGAPIQPSQRVLDFGVGWGRIARFFLRDCPPENLYGIDVDPEFVRICRECFESDNFSVCQPFPPTDFPGEYFDLIVGYSVFSHLSEQACLSWVEEFARIMRPGGILALTTRSRDFFAYCEALRDCGSSPYEIGLSAMFDDFDEARRRYDAGELVHSNASGVTGGEVRTADFYGETFIPERYARQAYSRWFDFQKFLYAPPRQNHPILFFKKLH